MTRMLTIGLLTPDDPDRLARTPTPGGPSHQSPGTGQSLPGDPDVELGQPLELGGCNASEGGQLTCPQPLHAAVILACDLMRASAMLRAPDM
jgi:hypothetical protein